MDAALSLHGVQFTEMNNLDFKDSKKVNLHLVVGEPIVNINNTTFDNSEGLQSNSKAYSANNVTYKNQLK